MASISVDANGNRTIQFVGKDKKRRSIRLGKVSLKVAETVKYRIESLNAAAIAGVSWDGDLSAWVAKMGDDLAERLAGVGLIPARQSRNMSEFFRAYLERRKAESKPATIVTIERAVIDLEHFFGPGIGLRDVTELRADEFRNAYLAADRGLALATVSRRLKNVRMLFGHALKMKLIDRNPFEHISYRSENPDARRVYVSVEHANKVIDVCSRTGEPSSPWHDSRGCDVRLRF